MQGAIRILASTPLWVFSLFAYLLWQGLKSLRPRTMSIWRALLVPVIFIVMGLSRILLRNDLGAAPYVSWMVAAALFAPLGILTGPRRVTVDRGRGEITRPGSPITLIRNVTVFCLQYAVAVADAMAHDSHAAVLIAGRALSGASAGYFAGWAFTLLRRYRRSPADANSN